MASQAAVAPNAVIWNSLGNIDGPNAYDGFFDILIRAIAVFQRRRPWFWGVVLPIHMMLLLLLSVSHYHILFPLFKECMLSSLYQQEAPAPSIVKRMSHSPIKVTILFVSITHINNSWNTECKSGILFDKVRWSCNQPDIWRYVVI